MSTLYGRNEGEWDELTRTGTTFLIECARLQKTTSYSELNDVLANRTGQPTFDFSQSDGRAAMGRLLGRIVDDTWDPDTKLMLSSIVLYLGGNDAGSGFYELAADKGLIPRKASAETKLDFWVMQVKQIYAKYAGGRGTDSP